MGLRRKTKRNPPAKPPVTVMQNYALNRVIGDDETGWFGTVEATLSFFVSKKAAKGKKEIAVRVAHRACGEGACRPEEVLSLSVPVEVV